MLRASNVLGLLLLCPAVNPEVMRAWPLVSWLEKLWDITLGVTNLQKAAGVILLDHLQAILHQARGLAQLDRAVRNLVSHHLQRDKESGVAWSCWVLGDGSKQALVTRGHRDRVTQRETETQGKRKWQNWP